MKSHPSSLGMVLACLACLAACNRPTTEAAPVSVLEKAAARGHAAMSTEDALISSQVKLALVATEGLNGEDIAVTTRQGQVTLSGSVPSRQIARAVAVARNVDGVRGVSNKLRPIGIMV